MVAEAENPQAVTTEAWSTGLWLVIPMKARTLSTHIHATEECQSLAGKRDIRHADRLGGDPLPGRGAVGGRLRGGRAGGDGAGRDRRRGGRGRQRLLGRLGGARNPS